MKNDEFYIPEQDERELWEISLMHYLTEADEDYKEEIK